MAQQEIRPRIGGDGIRLGMVLGAGGEAGVAYVDGGVYSPTNADLLAGRELDLVVVSSPMSADPRSPRPLPDLPVRYRFHRFLRHELWALRGWAGRVVAIEPDPPARRAMGMTMLRSGRTVEIEEHAYLLARRRLREVAWAVGRPAGMPGGSPGTHEASDDVG